MKLTSYIPVTLDVDGDGIELGVKRLTFAEGSKLRGEWRALIAAELRRSRAAKESEGGSGDGADEYAAAQRNAESFAQFKQETIARYVRVHSKVVLETEFKEEVPIKTGEQLVDAFGGRSDIIDEIFGAVLLQNGMTPEQKKASKSRTDSSPSSGGSGPGPVGPRREMTAGSAESGDSAGRGDATSRARTPSGSTDPPTPRSSSTSARSYH